MGGSMVAKLKLKGIDGEKAEEYFDRVISERMNGWKDEPVEERDRQAIARFIYTVKHKPLSDYLELKRRDFELIGQRMDQAKFRELMFTYLSSKKSIPLSENVQSSGKILRTDKVSF